MGLEFKGTPNLEIPAKAGGIGGIVNKHLQTFKDHSPAVSMR